MQGIRIRLRFRLAEGIACPECACDRVRRSASRNRLDKIGVYLCLIPFRCKGCDHRFRRFSLPLAWREPRIRTPEDPEFPESPELK